jgi:hypothetical protein
MQRLQLTFALMAALCACGGSKSSTDPVSVADAGKSDAAAPQPPKSGAGGSSGKSAKPDAGAAGETAPSGAGAGGKDAGPIAAVGGGGSGGSAGSAGAGGVTGDDTDSGVPVMPRTDYAAIADEACEMAGGDCVPQGDCSRETDAHLPPICRPGVPGITCCRKGATECMKPIEPVCCDVVDGSYRAIGSRCDRGYPTCAGRVATWLATDKTCETRIDEAGPDAPNLWPGSVSAAEAGSWACKQVGGTTLEVGERCPDGTQGLALDGTHPCCIPNELCPEVNQGTECCTLAGDIMAKMCFDGQSMCHGALIGMGTLKEVPVGTCEPFTPTP